MRKCKLSRRGTLALNKMGRTANCKMHYRALCGRMLEAGVSCGSGELCRYRQNWFVLTACCTLGGIAYSSALPSLHQFVTSSTHPDDHSVQPGLGLSETWYSWIVSVLSIGELVGAIGISVLLQWFYTKHLLLVVLSVCTFGGILFGVGKYGWMLLIGRSLMGVFMGAVTVIIRAYIGETTSNIIVRLPSPKREKSTLKYTAFFIAFSVCTLSVLVGPGCAAVVAQIPRMDQFRWPGYFIVVFAVVLAVVTLAGFREKTYDVRRKGGSINCRSLPIPLYSVVFLIFAFFVVNWYFAVFETLLNPILSDNFGFDVQYNSYAFFGTLVFFPTGMLILYILQRLYIDNRITCFIGLLLALSGSLISTDWQALKGDPCDQFSEIEISNQSTSSMSYDANVSVSGSGESSSTWCSVDAEGYLCTAEKYSVNLEHCEEDDDRITNASCVCEAFAGVTDYNCFWNPRSRVTGRQCPRCAKLCRSHDRSLNLGQFLVGMSLVSMIVPIGRLSLTLIASDAIAGDSQAMIMGVLVAVGAVGRFTGPLWGNAAYLVASHHIYIVMNILSVSMLLVIVPYLLLYRTLKPAQQTHTQLSTSDSVAELELTITANKNHMVKELDQNTEGNGVQLKHFVVDDGLRNGNVEMALGGTQGERGVERREKSTDSGVKENIDSEQVLLLSDMDVGAEEEIIQ